MIKKSNKFKAPEWFSAASKEVEEKEKELFGYFSEIVGYGPEWCRQNLGKCIDKLEPRERNGIVKELNKIDITNKYVWSRFFYENWEEIRDLINVKPPEYDSKRKIIEFPRLTISDKISEKVNNLKESIKKNLNL